MANYEEDIEGRTGLRADDQNAPTEPLAPRHGGVPEVAKQFITYLHKHIKDKAVFEILSMYENSFSKITEKYFKSTPWPAAESISHLVDNDALFLILYRELYYRHLHTKMFPTLEQRFESWKNYQDLFNYLLSTPADQLSIELPGQWLWDIIDEFIYQFQAFCQHRLKIKSKAKEEITLLQNNPQMWNIHTLISILQGLINKGGVVGSGKEGTLELMGYFSNIGLCRVYCLLGDYHLALESLETIDFTAPKALFTQVIGCHISLYYYLGKSIPPKLIHSYQRIYLLNDEKIC